MSSFPSSSGRRPRVLITGASGMLGERLLRSLASDWELAACTFKNRAAVPCETQWAGDLSRDRAAFVEFVSDWKPEAIIHCAAETRVDWCEQNPGEAYQANVEGMQSVCAAADASKAYLLAISTDSVFDGKKGGYAETDAVHPLNVYARTKYCAEAVGLAGERHACLLRTNFFGVQESAPLKGFAAWLLSQFSAKKEIPGFEDVIFSPLFVEDLAAIIGRLLQIKPTGVLHAASRDGISKADFAVRLAESRGLDDGLVRRCDCSSVPLLARRPLNTTLQTDRLAQLLDAPLPSVQEGLERFNDRHPAGIIRKSLV